MTEKRWRNLSLALFAVLSALIALTFKHYGLTWDENLHWVYGEAILRWYTSFFRDRTALDFVDLYLYGGVFDVIAAAASRFSPLHPYETRHLVNALFGLGAIVAVYHLAAGIAGRAAGFWAAFLLTLTPRFYGHMFQNPKDIPFAALFVMTLHALLRLSRDFPRPPLKSILSFGFWLGLCLGLRMGGVILYVYFWLAWFLWRRQESGKHTHAPPLHNEASRISLLAIFTAWPVMLIAWPWAQMNPLLNPASTLKSMAAFHLPLPIFFNGVYYKATELPWTYLPTWLAVTLPEFYFLLLPLVILAFRGVSLDRGKKRSLGLLLFAASFPILTTALKRPPQYDSLRHFLFLMPLFAALAGIALTEFWRCGARLVKGLIAILLVLSAVLTMRDMAELHPYQSVYFNRAVGGGLAKAAEKFETDYWGSSYKEGAEWMMAHYPKKENGSIRVANCGKDFQTEYYFEKSDADRFFETWDKKKGPDILLATTRFDCHEALPGKTVHKVTRQGAALLYILEISKPSAPAVS
jgi:hypothetical protein